MGGFLSAASAAALRLYPVGNVVLDEPSLFERVPGSMRVEMPGFIKGRGPSLDR
jgi:hypothetical protein